jgi:hypothetical protein
VQRHGNERRAPEYQIDADGKAECSCGPPGRAGKLPSGPCPPSPPNGPVAPDVGAAMPSLRAGPAVGAAGEAEGAQMARFNGSFCLLEATRPRKRIGGRHRRPEWLQAPLLKRACAPTRRVCAGFPARVAPADRCRLDHRPLARLRRGGPDSTTAQTSIPKSNPKNPKAVSITFVAGWAELATSSLLIARQDKQKSV